MPPKRHTSKHRNVLGHFSSPYVPDLIWMHGFLGQTRAKQCGPSCCPCQSLYLVMSPPNTWRRTCHCAQGTHSVARQHVQGRRHGASIMLMAYPELSLVCGSAGKQKIRGKAKGEPRIQIQVPICSTTGRPAEAARAQERLSPSRHSVQL